MTFILDKKSIAISLAIVALVLVFGASAGAQQSDADANEIVVELRPTQEPASPEHDFDLSRKALEQQPQTTKSRVLEFRPVSEEKIEKKIEREVKLEIVFARDGQPANISKDTKIALSSNNLNLRLPKEIVIEEDTQTVSVSGVLDEKALPGTVIEIKGVAKLPTGEEIQAVISFEVSEELLPAAPTEEVRKVKVEEEEKVEIDLKVISEVELEDIILPQRGAIAVSLSEKLKEEQLKVGLTLIELSSGKTMPLKYNSKTNAFEATNLPKRLYQLSKLPKGVQVFLEEGSMLKSPPAGGGGGGSAYYEETDGVIVQSNQVVSDGQGGFGGSLEALDLTAQTALVSGNVVVTLTNEQGEQTEATVLKDGLVEAQNLDPAEIYALAITDRKGNDLTMFIKVTWGQGKVLPPFFGRGRGAAPSMWPGGILLLAGAGLMGFALLFRSRLARGAWLAMLAAGLITGLVGLGQIGRSGLPTFVPDQFGRPGGGLSTFVPPTGAACVCSFEVARMNTQYQDGSWWWSGNSVVATTQNEEAPSETVYVAACLRNVDQTACGRIGGPCQRFCIGIFEEKQEEKQAALDAIYDEVPHDVDVSGTLTDSHDLAYQVDEWNALPFDPHAAAVETGIGTMGGEAVGRPWACFANCDPGEGFNWVQNEGPDLEGGSLDYGLGFLDAGNIIFGDGYNGGNTPPDSADPEEWGIRIYRPEPESE